MRDAALAEAKATGNLVDETMVITGLDCADCAAKLEKAVSRMPGVHQAEINFGASKLRVVYDGIVVNREDITARVRNQGYDVEESKTRGRETVLRLDGLDCPDCAAKLEKKLKALPGVQGVVLNFGAAKVAVQHSVPVAEVINAVEEAGYGAKPEGTAGDKRDTAFWQVHRRAVITSISGVALALGWILSAVGVAGPAVTGLYLAAMVVGGGFTARRAYFSARSLVLDMNVLMTVAVAGAALIGEWFEGATVAFLYSVSNAMEYYSMEKTRRSIRSLMELAPKEALVRRNGSELRMPVEEVRVGDAIVVRPGEKIPMDGVVTGGRSSVNQAPITGESMPVEKSEGDEVYAGTINQQGSLEITVTKLVADTTLSKIIHLVEEAQAQRAPSQRFVDRFAKYYTPAVIALAAGFVLVPPLFFGQQWAPWVYRGLALLVVSCPCALVISTPVSIVSGIGNAARNGVLIKGGAYLEEAGALSVVTFDKTGTLTKGRPEVTDIIPFNGASREEVLSLAAAVETRSEHPLAEAIVRKARELGLAIKEAGNFESITGKGARADIAGQACYIGSPRLFDDLGIQLRDVGEQLARLQEQGKTVMILGAGETVTGLIAVADQVRETGKAAIRKLREAGIKKVVMLTGDNEGTARAIAAELGLDEYRAELLPQDKVAAVKSLLDKYGKVAMVGDGINDAPALATATVGIAMGVAGTDTALETADIALMADDLSKLSYAMKLSRATLRTIKQNIAFSLVIKLAAVLLVFPGWLTLLVAILADMGASLVVTLNGMRLIGMKPEQ